MLVLGFAAQAFATNCYVVAPAAGEECVVVDPGFGVVDRLEELLREHRLRPAAVLLTHGHADHVWSVTPVCGARNVPAYVHTADRYRLRDPLATLDPVVVAMLAQQFGPATRWQEPDDVRTLQDARPLDVAGLRWGVVHAPGHTEGSVMFRLDRAQAPGLLLSGDVLFAGSIGRTDLPGGDPVAMTASLRDRVLPLDDDIEVLPGHGPATTIGRERAVNPYLQGLVHSPA